MNMMTAMPPRVRPAAAFAHLEGVERNLKLRRLFAHFDRDDIEQAVELLIDMLDAEDGDCDFERNGDELDGSLGEDEFMQQFGSGPGCPVSDPDCAVDDANTCGSGDYAYAEWTSLAPQRRRAGHIDGKPIDPWATYVQEDAEDDDPREDCGEDRCAAGDDMIRSGPETYHAGTRSYEYDVREGKRIGDDVDAEEDARHLPTMGAL